MSKQDRLFLLIKSLTKSEKRFIKLYAGFSQSKTPNYIYLFDILDQMEQYDANLLMNKISLHIDFSYINQLKKYLKEHIFESLRLYHKKNAYRLQQDDDLSIARTLIYKNLYEDAEKVLRKLKKQAIQKEHFTFLISVNETFLYLLEQKGQRDLESQKQMMLYYKEIISYQQKALEINELKEIIMRARLIIYAQDKIKRNIKKELNEILKEQVLTVSPQRLSSSSAKYTYFNLLSILYNSLGKEVEYFETLKEIIKLKDNSSIPLDTQAECLLYINLSICYIKQKEKQKFFSIINAISKILAEHPKFRTKYIYWKYLRLCEFYIMVPEEKPFKAFFNEINFILTSPEVNLSDSNKNGLTLALSKYYFHTNQFEKSQNTLNNLTLTKNIQADEFYFLEIKLLSIVCNYELNFLNIAKNQLLNLKRKLKRELLNDKDLMDLLKLLTQLVNIEKNPTKTKKHLEKIAFFIEALQKKESTIAKKSFLLQWLHIK